MASVHGSTVGTHVQLPRSIHGRLQGDSNEIPTRHLAGPFCHGQCGNRDACKGQAGSLQSCGFGLWKGDMHMLEDSDLQRRNEAQWGQRHAALRYCSAKIKSPLSNNKKPLSLDMGSGESDSVRPADAHKGGDVSSSKRSQSSAGRSAKSEQRGTQRTAGRRRFLAVSTCLCAALTESHKLGHAESLDWSQSQALCSQCHGSGALPCSLCGGTGQWLQGFQNGNQVRVECPQCSGRGVLKCVRCLGTGLGDTGGLLRGAAVKEGHMRVRADGSIEILDCDYFPATRGTDCRPSATDNRITEERALTAPRGGLFPRPDLVDIAKKTWRIVEKSTER